MPEQSSAKPSFGLENFTTLPQLLVNSVERYGEREALRQFDKETKSWHSLSYAQLMVRVMEWRRAYAAMNLERGTRIGILMPNSIDHACADQAALANGLVPVPLHAIDTPGASAFILSDSRAKVLVTNKLTRWKQIKAAGGDLQDLTAVIITEDEVDDETGMVRGLSEWLAAGTHVVELPEGPKEDDLAGIVYTSGTTGRPKGVMLTHGNIVSNVKATLECVFPQVGDIFLSFLPLSHTFERTAGYYLALATGCTIAYNRSVLLLADDLKTIRPTVIISVPRVYERIFARVHDKLKKSRPAARYLFDWAVEIGWRDFCRRNHLPVEHTGRAWLDGLMRPLVRKVSSTLLDQFGGRLRIAISGGAALSSKVARTFCGLNDVRNIAPSIKYAKEAGMISQCSLCITHSPVHTVEYYTKMAFELIELGADEICIKDMAGIGRPYTLGRIVANIKEKYPEIPIQYHSHAGPGFNVASIMEVCNAGCDYIDVGMEPLSWGTGHADLLTVQAMLKDAGYKVPEINMEAYMKVRALVQEFMDDFLGLYISPKNRLMNSLLIGPGLPGGMMGSLMADLEKNLETINKSNIKNNKPLMSQDQLLIKLFDEVAYVWPRVGYPPLVTPFSQYVKNLALMNVMQMEKGKARWSMIADDIWDMILGKAGRLPGPLAPEIIEKAQAEGRKFFEGNPQDNYPDALDKYRKLMNEKQWEVGEDEEELFEYAMHPAQYEAYRSGKAKVAGKPTVPATPAAPAPAPAAALTMPTTPQVMTVDVNGQAYHVTVAFGDTNSSTPEVKPTVAPAPTAPEVTNVPAGAGKEVLSPLEGKFFLVKNASDTPVKVGDVVKEGDVLCYVEAMKTYNAVRAEFGGTITAICLSSGDAVSEDDVLMTIQ